MRFLKSVCVLVLLLAMPVSAQNYATQRSQVLFSNLLSNALIGGIGGAINKKSGEKAAKVFARNFFKGALGGLVKYAAKYQAYYLARSNGPAMAHLNRMWFFLGHSFTMNAARNLNLFESYECNLYGFELKYIPGHDKKVTARLSLATVLGAAMFASQNYRFNFYRSLEYGVLYFDMSPAQSAFTGFATFNCIAVKEISGRTSTSVIPHEVLHTYQMYDYFGLSAFYNRFTEKYYTNRNGYKKLSPYLVLDYEWAFYGAAYGLQPKPRYFRNYFEFEAEHFSSRRYLKRA